MPSRPTNLAKRRACQASPGSVDSERRTKPLRWNIRRRFLHRIVVESRDLVAAHALGARWIVGAQAFHTPITPSIILASDALFQGVSIAGFDVRSNKQDKLWVNMQGAQPERTHSYVIQARMPSDASLDSPCGQPNHFN